jgi:hypothetical protein
MTVEMAGGKAADHDPVLDIATRICSVMTLFRHKLTF